MNIELVEYSKDFVLKEGKYLIRMIMPISNNANYVFIGTIKSKDTLKLPLSTENITHISIHSLN